jgi:predicted RNA-binding Zn-ribbon protein involved in translation (DUF1610 family)
MVKNKTQCISCGSLEAFITTDDTYHGLHGICPDCGSNWPES